MKLIGDFRYAFLEGLKYFLKTQKANICIKYDKNEGHIGIFIKQIQPNLIKDDSEIILNQIEIDRYVIISEEIYLIESPLKVQDKAIELGFFKFFDIEFDKDLDKLFFSFMINNLPDEHLNNFIKIMKKNGDDKFVTFKKTTENKQKFWVLFEILHEDISSNQMLEIFNSLYSFAENNIETVQEIDSRIYAFLSIRPDLLFQEKDQLSMFNAMSNIVGKERALKYKDFLSTKIKQDIEKTSFITDVHSNIIYISINFNTLYHQVQIYPLGGIGKTVFVKMIEKIIQEISDTKMMGFDKFNIITDEKNQDKIEIFIHCNNSEFEQEDLLDLIKSCAQHIIEEQSSKDLTFNNVELIPFIKQHILNKRIISRYQHSDIPLFTKKI